MTENIIRKNRSNFIKSFIDNTKLYFSDENFVSLNETSICSTEMRTNKKIKVSSKQEEIKANKSANKLSSFFQNDDRVLNINSTNILTNSYKFSKVFWRKFNPKRNI